MPELPEVARTALSLNEAIKGKQIKEVKIHSGRYSRHGSPDGFDQFCSELPVSVENVSFRGKFILLTTSKENKKWFIWNTLGMSGGWKREKSKHGHVEFHTGQESFFFTDMRNFGTLKFTDSESLTQRKLLSIGPDHLSTEISDQEFTSRLMKRSKQNITKVLMNQNIIGGVGNYIKAEALYMSAISPHRSVESLTESEFSLLNKSIKKVVVSSFRSGGNTIKTYSGMDNEKGDFVFSLKVYGRKKCEMGFDVIRETTPDGRTTHWVPQIQK